VGERIFYGGCEIGPGLSLIHVSDDDDDDDDDNDNVLLSKYPTIIHPR